MLSATNISHTFTTTSGEEVEALRDISLTIPGGQVVSIVGPSGCGKSTLLRIFGGFFPPTSGEVAGGPDDEDVFVRRFTAAGAQLWTKTFASAADDYLFDIAALGASEYYLVGTTTGNLGGRNRGGSDTFVLRLSGNGTQVWAR